MSTLLVLLTLSGLLGLTSFGIGILPLSITFSGAHMSRLSSLGTGLLLGAALGVIIPEGIEALARSRPSGITLEGSSIAMPLLFGFTFMLIVEQLGSSHAHHHHHQYHHARRPSQRAAIGIASPDSVFDVELAGLDDVTDSVPAAHERRASASSVSPTKTNFESDTPSAYPITLGLVLHGLADGLALGMSMLSNDESSSHPYALSLVVFMALAVHKAPTALAYTVSLMSTSLSRVECKKHLILFSSSTPVGAIASYASFSFFGSKHVDGVGTALLISAGSFLYVATVLQPVSHDRRSFEGVGSKMRILLIVLGIFIPFALGTLLGHGHDDGTIAIPP